MSGTPPRNYFVRPDEVRAYSTANHTGTVNRRLIAPETVGAELMEVLLGVIEKGSGAQPHAHPGMEQACYILRGRARVEIAGQSREIGPGEMCFFPAGEEHVFTVVSEDPVHVLVIYSPPYGEDPARVARRVEARA